MYRPFAPFTWRRAGGSRLSEVGRRTISQANAQGAESRDEAHGGRLEWGLAINECYPGKCTDIAGLRADRDDVEHMKTPILPDNDQTWRLSFQATAVFAGLLISFGIATLLLVFSSGDPASVANPAAQYAYWFIGFGALVGVALLVRWMVMLKGVGGND